MTQMKTKIDDKMWRLSFQHILKLDCCHTADAHSTDRMHMTTTQSTKEKFVRLRMKVAEGSD
jgi:hypothetical protein